MLASDPGTHTFSGLESGADGRTHTVARTTCAKCGKTIAETHFGCCGHASSGWGKPCECRRSDGDAGGAGRQADDREP